MSTSNEPFNIEQISSDRLKALSDGVFAIVITLLVLVRVPEISESLVATELLPRLNSHKFERAMYSRKNKI